MDCVVVVLVVSLWLYVSFSFFCGGFLRRTETFEPEELVPLKSQVVYDM